MTRVVVAIDPAVTSGEEADETGIVVAGKDQNGHGYVLADISGRYPPTEWARFGDRRLRDAPGRPHCGRGQQRRRHIRDDASHGRPKRGVYRGPRLARQGGAKGARDWFDRLRRGNPTLLAHWELCHGNGRTSGAV